MTVPIASEDLFNFFFGIATLGVEERQTRTVNLTIGYEGVNSQDVTVITLSPDVNPEYSVLVVETCDTGRLIATRLYELADVSDASEDAGGEELTVDSVLDGRFNPVSFDYTTARGTQKRITGLTPAYTQPSENHPGKTLFVGFKENEETGSYDRKQFRTDRITNLTQDNA